MTMMSENGLIEAPQGKGMHVGLWVIQGLLAAAFLAAGLMKMTAPVEQLQAQMPWVNGAMGSLVRFIGASEALGALGVVLPAAARVKPGLTPLAALGLTVVMALALATHLARGEFAMAPAPVILGAMAAFVAWGRSQAAPITPRA